MIQQIFGARFSFIPRVAANELYQIWRGHRPSSALPMYFYISNNAAFVRNQNASNVTVVENRGQIWEFPTNRGEVCKISE